MQGVSDLTRVAIVLVDLFVERDALLIDEYRAADRKRVR